jgi:PAS domain S-box-containing protein
MAPGERPAPRGLPGGAWIPAIYFVASAVWVGFSDALLSSWVGGDTQAFERWSTLKGWGWVTLTTLAMAWGLGRVQARQRAASASLDKLEQRARALVESSPDAIVLQEGLRIAYANPAAVRLLGAATPEELVGRSVLEVVDPSERAAVEERSLQAEEARPFPPVLVRRMRRLDGSAFHAEVALARFPGPGEKALQVTLRDVTHAWLLQEEVRRINGALRTLGAVNEALVRAGSERELMDEVCRLAVDGGGYRLAWVGLATPGEAQPIRPVAVRGAPLPGEAAVGGGWSDATRVGGLAATALRTGQPCVVNDLSGEAGSAASQETARRRGFASGIALPMSHGSERLGALTLLAGEPDAFDPPVVQLLRQLADDLAFGLVALRTRAALASEREFLDAVLQNAGVLISVVDRGGRLVRANAEYERLTGWPVAELVGRLAWDRLVAPDQARRYAEDFPAMWHRTFPVVAGSQIITRSGEVRVVEWVQTALRDAAGVPAYLVGIGHDVTDRNRAEARLLESRQQLRALAGRLQSVREEEKARMARDLHDELGQLLTGLKMDLRWLERRLSDLPASEAVNTLVDRVVAASELVDQTVASVQRIAGELRSGALDRLGLAPALRQEARRFQERTGIACEARVDEAAPEPPAEVATALYRICQEALTNVSRHARASRVVVSLAAEAAGLVLRVEDDGRGFDAAAPGPEALGLLGMTERATLLGGEVGFSRRPEGGTVVTARVPLASAPAEAP